MKRNFKVMAMAAMAVAIGMSSCSNDNDNVVGVIDNGETTSVSIKLSEGTKSRAVTAPVDEVPVNFKDGYALFVNGVGVINKVTQIAPGTYSESTVAGKETAEGNGTMVWLEDMKTSEMGAAIKNVPASAEKVYIVGNLPTGVAAPALTEGINSVLDRIIVVGTQSNSEGSVADVTLYGDGADIEDMHPTLGADTKYADVTVNAIASRIEIGAISYSNSATNFVTGFQIDGIFVNYYYPQMSLASKVSVGLINNAPGSNSVADGIYTTASGGAYNDAAISVLCDFNATAPGLGHSISSTSKSAAVPNADPEDKNVWAYNVLAPKSVDGATVAALEAPHVVIRLSGLTTKDDVTPGSVYTTTQYLTVKEFRDVTTEELISSFDPGYIYFIKNLTFDESNLTPIPEEEPVTVYVEAKLMTWSRKEVVWGF